MEDQETDRVGQLAAKLTGQTDNLESAADEASSFQLAGWMMLALGVGIAGYSLLGFDVTAPYSDTVNLGLLNEQLIFAISGGALFLSGTVTIGISAIIRRL